MYDPVSAITAIVPTALSAVGTIVGMDSSRKAAHQQEDAAAAAAAGFDPYKKAGVNALWNLEDRINAGPGEFTKSPGYDFRLQQGVNALDRSAAARGKLLSGSQAKAITQYGQDYASNEYQNWLNNWYKSLTPYQNLVNTGLSAQGASVLPTMTVGESQAAGTLGQANSLNNLLNWGTNQVPAVTNMFSNPGYSAPSNYFNSGLASGGNAWGGSPWASATMGIF